MPITDETMKRVLGDKYDPNATYQIARHAERSRLEGLGYPMVGEVPDATTNQNGTMLIFKTPTRVPYKKVYPEPTPRKEEPPPPKMRAPARGETVPSKRAVPARAGTTPSSEASAPPVKKKTSSSSTAGKPYKSSSGLFRSPSKKRGK